MMDRHVGRLGKHAFILRLGSPRDAAADSAAHRQYWEIEYEGRVYPWRPVHPEDDVDVARLMRTARSYLRGDLQRHG